MKLVKLLTALVLSFSASTVWAGAYFNHQVSFGDNYLHGNVYSATNASDTVQYIGCYINAFETTATVICVARNSDGGTKTCLNTSPNEATLNAVSGINNTSFISATIDDSGRCTRILVHTNSAFSD